MLSGVAKVADHEANFFVGNFCRERLFDGLEVVEAEFGGRIADFIRVDWMDPIGAEGKFAFFNEVGD